MRLELVACEVGGDAGGRAPLSASGRVGVGAYEVHAELDGERTSWRVVNRGGADRPRHVRLVHRVVDAPDPLRMFRHGYQSWSPSGTAVFGVDQDPSADPGCFRFVRDAYLGDPDRTAPGELRSELVTVLGGEGGPWTVVGFDGARDHDGTLRLRPGADGPELVAEAFLGSAVLAAGEERSLHGFGTAVGGDPSALLEAWAAEVGRRQAARVAEPYQVGWCSWYHYFHQVTEVDVRRNLDEVDDWPFTVFQVDDGYQRAIGDWLETAGSFPSGLGGLAEAIAATGRRPGLWLAPFLAAPDSQVAADHPDWLVQLPDGSGPMPSWFNPAWGGAMWGLDTTRADVQDHLATVARSLVDLGFTYLKLDFTMAPGLDGRFADESATPAQRVRAGYDAVRRGAGDDAFLLGCGAPIGPCIGVVDAMRIGADVAPSWPLPGTPLVPGLDTIEPATAHAYASTVTRAFQHRRLWLNDPDCLMLRTTDTALDADQARTWAHTVAVSGGLALVSDDLGLLDEGARRLLEEVIEVGRRADEEARRGRPARTVDLLDATPPQRFAAAGLELETDPATGRSILHER